MKHKKTVFLICIVVVRIHEWLKRMVINTKINNKKRKVKV